MRACVCGHWHLHVLGLKTSRGLVYEGMLARARLNRRGLEYQCAGTSSRQGANMLRQGACAGNLCGWVGACAGHVCVRGCVCACVNARVSVCARVCACVCECVCVHMCVCLYKHALDVATEVQHGACFMAMPGC